MSKLDRMLDAEKIRRFEGEEGVRNLARVSHCLGYLDSTHFGQFQGACYGDLIQFLADNPGAVEAVLDFIRNNEDKYEYLDDYSDEEETDNTVDEDE